ncbi:hypothetical protein OSB04_012878, partial [Centaurea solstitialis]
MNITLCVPASGVGGLGYGSCGLGGFGVDAIMIYVNGVRFPTDSSPIQGPEMVNALLEHPHLISASQSFHAIPERKFSVSEESGSQGSAGPKCVYVFQREYAIADPALVEIVGTDEATTCIGIVVRNCKSGMTSIAHMDSPNIVDIGLSQMLSLVSDGDDAILDGNSDTESEQDSEMKEYSFELCIKIVEQLAESKVNFHIQNFQVLKNNTRWDSEGNAYPIFHGLAVETSCGSVGPASFDRSTRCPDEVVRRIRLGASFEDPGCTGRLLETYETQTDRIVIPPVSCIEFYALDLKIKNSERAELLRSMRKVHIAMAMRHRSDMEILLTTSTSPSAEGPDFVDNQK